MRHRSDQADGTHSSLEAKVASGPVSTRRADYRRERCNRFETLENLVTGHDTFPRQLSHLSDRHQLDESYVPIMFESEMREIRNLVVVDAAHDHDVELDRRQSCALGSRRRRDRIETDVATRDGLDAIGP